MEKDGGRVEKQTKTKLCNGRGGGDVHAACGRVCCGMVYRDFFWGGSSCGGFLFVGSCMGKHVAIEIHVAITTWCYASVFGHILGPRKVIIFWSEKCPFFCPKNVHFFGPNCILFGRVSRIEIVVFQAQNVSH